MADGRAAWVPAGRAELSGGELGVNFSPTYGRRAYPPVT